MDLGVRGRSYLLVGGTRGMGYEAAQVLAAEGARLALIGRSGKMASRAASALADEFGIEARGYAGDASRSGAVETAIAAASRDLGTPRGLLITTGSTDRNGDLLATDDADWDANCQDVLMGHVRVLRAVIPAMAAAGGGTIVTTAAYSVRAAKSFLFPYAAFKAALVNLTKNLAKTYGADGIRANCVCPGAFETAAVAAAIDRVAAETGLERDAAAAHLVSEVWRMPVALRRPGRPREVGELMAFLLSERAAYLTGAIINIDGGTDF